jgi:hypothetical protein
MKKSEDAELGYGNDDQEVVRKYADVRTAPALDEMTHNEVSAAPDESHANQGGYTTNLKQRPALGIRENLNGSRILQEIAILAKHLIEDRCKNSCWGSEKCKPKYNGGIADPSSHTLPNSL